MPDCLAYLFLYATCFVMRNDMATVYYPAQGTHGNTIDIDEVIHLFEGRPKMAMGLTPPGLAGTISGVCPIAVIEIGPEEVRAPEFLDFGFYMVG